MEILEEKVYNQVKKFMIENNIDIGNRGIVANSNMCTIISKFINYKYSVNEILLIYDFITDVLQGKIPKIINEVPKEERIRTAIKLLDKNYISFYKNDLNVEEKEKFAWCIVYSYFTYGFNEETGEMEQVIYDFTSLDKIEKEYYYEKETFPSKFSVIKYSDDSNENYGFVVENPIEVTSVELEYKYLNSLITLDNKKISYERIGSFSGKNNTYVDGYEIYKKGIIGRKKIGTIYISGDGSSNATKAPKGFKFI